MPYMLPSMSGSNTIALSIPFTLNIRLRIALRLVNYTSLI